MITLYFTANTRSMRALWTLEELGLDYTLKLVDLKKQEHKQEEFLKINPTGLVPALKDGDTSMYESVAMCSYLADRYGGFQLSPRLDSPLRGTYYQLLFFLVSSVEQPFVELLNQKIINSEVNYEQDFPKYCAEINKNLEILSKQLSDKKYFLGEQFTIADINISGCLLFAKKLNMLFNPDENLITYLERVQQRPAYIKMREIEVSLVK